MATAFALAVACAPAQAVLIPPGPAITTVAGTGVVGNGGDTGAATSATFTNITAIAARASGAYLIADDGAHVVRQVEPNGVIDRVAGTGNPDTALPPGSCNAPYGTDPLTVNLSGMVGVAELSSGSLYPGGPGGFYILDAQNGCVHVVHDAISQPPQPATIETTATFPPTNGALSIAAYRDPSSYLVGTQGDIETGDYFPPPPGIPPSPPGPLSSVTPANQVRGVATGGGPDDAAGRFWYLDNVGNNWFLRQWNNGSPFNLIGQCSFSCTSLPGRAGVPAQQMSLVNPTAVAGADDGGVVIADAGTNSIDYYDPLNQQQGNLPWVTTIAGDGSQCPPQPDQTKATNTCGDGSNANFAQLSNPNAVTVTPDGLLISDQGDNRVRMVASEAWLATPPAITNSLTGDFYYGSWDQRAQMLCDLEPPNATPTGFQPCTSMFDPMRGNTEAHFGTQAEGTYTFKIAYVDPYGTPDPTPLTYTWTVDHTPPSQPTGLTGPSDPTNQTGADFTFTKVDTGGTMKCSLDSSNIANFTPCDSDTSMAYAGPIADGQHTFYVSQVDDAGNFSPPATWTWTVDTTPPPPPTIGSCPKLQSQPDCTTSPTAPLTTTSASFSFSVANPADGAVTCNLDGGGFAACTSPKSYTNLGQGSHTFTVEQTDGAGNAGTASYTWSIDTVKPVAPTINTKPNAITNGQSDFDFTFTPAEDPNQAQFAGDKVQCSLNSAPYQDCDTFTSQTYPYSIDSPAPEGSYNFAVREVDAAGNFGTPATYSWLVDRGAPPPPTLTLHPTNPTVATAANFAFTSTDSSGVMHCKLDGPGAQTGTYVNCDSFTGTSYGPLAAGTYTFSLYQTDGAGNNSDPPTTYTWTVNPPDAPTITAQPANPSNAPTASFAFTSETEAAGTMRCDLDGGGYTDCTSPQQYSGLSEGSHTFSVRQRNAAGDDGAVTTFTWMVDLTPPAAPALESPADGAGGQPAKPSFSWDPVSDGVKYQLSIDGTVAATVTNCAATCSADAPSNLTEAQHKWKVTAFDAAGNTKDSAERTFNVAVAPVAKLVVTPNPALTGHTITFDASGSTDYGTGIVDYQWDLDGDGKFETDTGATPTTTRTFQLPASITARVLVTDGVGLTADASASENITTIAPTGRPVGVSINDGAQFTNDPNVTIFSVWPSFATTMLFSNDGGFVNAQSFPVAEQHPWVLDSSGPERLPKTVYVRFQAAAPTTQNFTDDIILDQTPPKVVSATLASGATGAAANASATAAKANKRFLILKATDNVSGVGAVQITTNKNKPGKLLKYKKKLPAPAGKKLFVRVQDRAQNFSVWKPVRG